MAIDPTLSVRNRRPLSKTEHPGGACKPSFLEMGQA